MRSPALAPRVLSKRRGSGPSSRTALGKFLPSKIRAKRGTQLAVALSNPSHRNRAT